MVCHGQCSVVISHAPGSHFTELHLNDAPSHAKHQRYNQQLYQQNLLDNTSTIFIPMQNIRIPAHPPQSDLHLTCIMQWLIPREVILTLQSDIR